MAAPKPALIAGEIDREISALLEGTTHFFSPDQWRIMSALSKVDKLMKVDAGIASLQKAAITHLMGEWEEALRWIRNGRNNGMGYVAERTELFCAANLGYFSRASELFSKHSTVSTGLLTRDVNFAFTVGNFRDFLDRVEALQRADLDLPEASMVELAKRADSAMKKLGVDHDAVTQMLDVAGEVLREHRLFWQTEHPLVHASDDADCVGVLFQLFVGVTPPEADQLTDEVLDRVIERGLVRPGISFSFIGTQGADEWLASAASSKS